MSRFAQSERSALCDTLLQLGPDQPTLCAGWQTRDLAAHLLVRERRPDAAAAALIPALAGHRDRVTDSAAKMDWTELVRAIRSGPPPWTIFAIPVVDEMANLAEFFVHHEDARRAQNGFTARDLGSDMQRALWVALMRVRRLLLRNVPVGVLADADEFGTRPLRAAPNGRGQVVVKGAPAEMLLYVFGRCDAAAVTLDGSPEDLRAFRSALGV